VRLEESGNRGARVTVRYRDGRRRARWIPPGGGVQIGVAAAVLRTNTMKLYRLIRAGELAVVKHGPGRWTIPLPELRRLRRGPRALRDRRRG